jgi:ABC-type multidrug transport system fused ATPase/permease subunit
MLETVRRLFGLLLPAERRRARLLFLVMLVVAVLETAGVVSIMPFMALVANPHIVEANPYLARLYHALEFNSTNAFLVFAGVVTLVLLTLSNAASMLLVWVMFRFVYLQDHLLSARLIERYVGRPYAFFLTRNSAELVKNILSEVTSVVHGLLIPSLQIAAKGLVALFLAGLLLAADPLLAMGVALVLGGAYAAIYLLVHGFLGRLGEVRNEANTRRFTAASSVLGGIKEIKLYQRAGYFLKGYEGASLLFARNSSTHQIIAQLPRYVLEVLAMGGAIVIILYLISSRGQLDRSLPLIGLYVLAGYRLMPALQQIFVSLASLRFTTQSLDILVRDMAISAPGEEPSAVQKNVPPLVDSIQLADVTFTYPGASEPAIRVPQLSIPARKSVAFVGTTGAGKSTIVDILCGLLVPDAGSVMVDGIRVDRDNVLAWQTHIGYVPQQIYLIDDTIARNIAFGLPDEEVDMARVEAASRAASLHEFVVRDLEEGYDTVVGERGVRLSGGERQRIGIARALYHDPDVLVFDEATAALDTNTESAVMQAIDALSGTKTLIMIAHRLATVRNCDCIFVIDKGRVVASGGYDSLVRDDERFRSMVQQMERQ